MKRYNVVAAVICDSINEKKKYLRQKKVMESLKAGGNFQVEKLRKERLLNKH